MCTQKLIDFDQNDRQVKAKLFKYYSSECYNICAFQNNQIFFAKPHLLNDSFDTSEKLIKPFKTFQERVNWTSEDEKRLDNHGIFSLIEADDVRKFQMWSFYARNFDGYALEFNKEVLSDNKIAPVHLLPVLYSDAPLNLDDCQLRLRVNSDVFTVGEVNFEYDRKLLDRVFQCLHLIKDKSTWQQENEWRMIIGNIRDRLQNYLMPLNDGYLLRLPQNPYKALYIGYKMDRCKRQALIQAARQKQGVDIFSVKPKIIDNKWDMEIERIVENEYNG